MIIYVAINQMTASNALVDTNLDCDAVLLPVSVVNSITQLLVPYGEYQTNIEEFYRDRTYEFRQNPVLHNVYTFRDTLEEVLDAIKKEFPNVHVVECSATA